MPTLPRLPTSGWLLVAGLGLCALGMARSAPQTPPPPTNQPPKTQIVPVTTAANADSNNRMIAVTGTDITGSSILYLVDTVNNRLAVYQAQGGADNSRGISFIGARRIDLDMQLDGYNDKSEYSVQELEKKFSEIGHGRPSK